MNRTDTDAALAHQQSLEHQQYLESRSRREDGYLSNDPGYLKWLEQFSEQVKDDEISSERVS